MQSKRPCEKSQKPAAGPAAAELTIEEAAEKIGTGTRAVRDAETGKPSTGAAVYAALLWTYDLLQPLEELADPQKDTEGLALAAAKESRRARRSGDLDDDF